MTAYEFMSDSPWLTFFLAWFLTELVFKITNRILRTIKVCVKGWPPSHIDADGDWKPVEKSE